MPAEEEDLKALNPSKTKFNQYLEDIRKKEQNQGGEIPGTFGDGSNAFNFTSSVHTVDPTCTFDNVSVLEDYSSTLTL